MLMTRGKATFQRKEKNNRGDGGEEEERKCTDIGCGTEKPKRIAQNIIAEMKHFCKKGNRTRDVLSLSSLSQCLAAKSMMQISKGPYSNDHVLYRLFYYDCCL